MSIKHVIGIVSPSSPVPDGLIKQSVEYFHKLGFKVKTGKHFDKKEIWIPDSEAKEIIEEGKK